jgi:hypothetical protein
MNVPLDFTAALPSNESILRSTNIYTSMTRSLVFSLVLIQGHSATEETGRRTILHQYPDGTMIAVQVGPNSEFQPRGRTKAYARGSTGVFAKQTESCRCALRTNNYESVL